MDEAGAGGGARQIISDPILNFWSKLGTGVRERFLYTPVTPKKFSEENSWGGGGRWVLEVTFRIFWVQFFCAIWP